MQRSTARQIVLAVMLIAGWGAQRSATAFDEPAACQCACARRGEWTVAETPNFTLWTHGDLDTARHCAMRCETLRRELISAWTGNETIAAWSPLCAVVIHKTQAEYRLSMNASDESAGCTTVTCDQGRVIFRRIDLRGDVADWQRNALPHELTHVVLADQLIDCSVATWLNEGMAMLSESEALQSQRLTLLERAAAVRSLPGLAEVLDDGQRSHLDANLRYAASFSLVRWLEQQGGRQRLLQFARHVRQSGNDQSLRGAFAIEGGLAELEQHWHASFAAPQVLAAPALAER